MNTHLEHRTNLLARDNLTLAYVSSLFIAFLMTVASVAGLLGGTAIYPTDELLQSFRPNDAVNLLFGLPVLLGSLWLSSKGRLVGLLAWSGTLFYVLYNYIVYLFGVPFSAVFLLYLMLVVLSTYTLIGLVATIDGKKVRRRLSGALPEKAAGGVLTCFGVLFLFRVISLMANALITPTAIAATEFSVSIADFITAPAWIIAGVILWRRETFGYVIGVGVLLQANMLFAGLILFLLLQPFLTTAPFNRADVFAVLMMGLACFMPLALLSRDMMTYRSSSTV